eukprot:6812720-Pyramimonas_sp.AAC.2
MAARRFAHKALVATAWMASGKCFATRVIPPARWRAAIGAASGRLLIRSSTSPSPGSPEGGGG